MVTELYPPGLNHAAMHVSTGDMPLTEEDEPFTLAFTSTAAVPADAFTITATQMGEGGALNGLTINSIAGADDVGNVHGFEVNASIAAGVAAGGRLYGGYIILSDGEGSSIASDAYGLRIMSMLNEPVTGDLGILRLELNGDETAISVIETAGTNAEYFLRFHQTGVDGWSATGDKSTGDSLGARGWLKVRVANFDRYVQLYGLAP